MLHLVAPPQLPENLLLRFNNANSSLGCSDDACSVRQSSLTRSVTGPGLFWAIVDGYDACGSYTMSYTLQ